jgi:STE24 endopeptidase
MGFRKIRMDFRKIRLTGCVFLLLAGMTDGIVAESQAAAPSPAYHLPPEKAAKAKALGKIRTAIHFGSEFWELALLGMILASGMAARLGRWAERKTSKGWLQGLLFSAVLVLLVFVAELPPGAIGHWFSLKYGISVQGWGSWAGDELKTMLLSVPLEALVLLLVWGLMHWGWSRRFWWIWLWAGAVPVMVAVVFLIPQIVDPLFNEFEPLAKTHPALVVELEKVVARTGSGIPADRMFLMKASEKSNGLNAYVTGLGATKRVVVWDTTADRMPVDQILFTFGHESGHYVLNHIPKGMTLGAVGLFFLFGLTVWLGGWLVRRFGVAWGVAQLKSLPGLAVLLLALSFWQFATEPVSSFGSRYVEHEADIYGQEAMHGIVADPQATAVAAFNTLGEAYLDDPEPNPFVEWWSYDHPSLKNRAEFAAQYDPWKPGGQPRFFSK